MHHFVVRRRTTAGFCFFAGGASADGESKISCCSFGRFLFGCSHDEKVRSGSGAGCTVQSDESDVESGGSGAGGTLQIKSSSRLPQPMLSDDRPRRKSHIGTSHKLFEEILRSNGEHGDNSEHSCSLVVNE